jgi:aryl-alcohol dehydrogenase-like predicted oxidoreductase
MNYRELGKTGIKVSEIGFGTWGIGGNASGAVGYGPTDDKESTVALRKAYELGVNFFDTADLYGYGHSEELIGETFKDVRKDVIIASKVGFLDFNGKQDFSSLHIKETLAASLKRLHTDYLDLYQLHSPTIEALENDSTILSTFASLKREGKIKAIGISVRTPDEGLAVVSNFNVDAIQVNLNLVDQRALENGLLAMCEKEKIGVIVRTPLCYGFLTGEYTAASLFGPQDQRRKWSRPQIERWANAYKLFIAGLTHQEPSTNVQFALRFCLSCPGVSTVIPGMLTEGQVEENIASSHLGALRAVDFRRVVNTYRKNVFFESDRSLK